MNVNQTIWDAIYKKYHSGGKAWGSLGEEMHPLFVKFVAHTDFPKRHALDIGCGEGKYLFFLRSLGFKVVVGIDSSGTAIKAARRRLLDEARLSVQDMYEYVIAPDTYDLIISLSTIHHGTKEQVKRVINRIYNALISRGYIFITLPDRASVEQWQTFKNSKEIAPGTFVPQVGLEKGLVHSFYKKSEVAYLFSQFQSLKIEKDTRGKWCVWGRKV